MRIERKTKNHDVNISKHSYKKTRKNGKQSVLSEITGNINTKITKEKTLNKCKPKRQRSASQKLNSTKNTSELKTNISSIDIDDRTFDRPYICSVCSKRYKHSCHVYRHMRIHSSVPESIPCPVDRHVRVPSSVPESFPCPVCEKGFKDEYRLKRHMKTDTDNRAFVCGYCDKRFLLSHNLTRHLKVHNGDKPHKCSVCDKQFAQEGDLDKHKRIHTGDKPFDCSVCAQSFGRSDALKRHMRGHTGETPYSVTCGNHFKRKESLTLHMKKHSG